MLPKTAYQNIDKMKKTRPTSKNFRTIPKELQLKSSLRLLLYFRKKSLLRDDILATLLDSYFYSKNNV